MKDNAIFSFLKSHPRYTIGLIALFYFSFLMLRITSQYLPYRLDVGFLRIKQSYLSIDLWRTAFFIHVYTSMITLLAGFTQFPNPLFKIKSKYHRAFGYVYVFTILAVTGPASFIMSLYANGGITSKIAFTLLSIFWMYYTYKALKCAKKGDIVNHKNFMIRSYALTLSALTLRAWKFSITNLFDFPPMDVYRFVAWAGWLGNLIAAELIIRYSKRKQWIL